MIAAPATQFVLPSGSAAIGPPERRGVPRDGVRMLVVSPEGVTHQRFRDLPDQLEPGDVLVLNTSATMPAALDGYRADGRPTLIHVSTLLDDGDWVVEVRRVDNTGPDLSTAVGEELVLPGLLRLQLTAPYPDTTAGPSRLWRAVPTPRVAMPSYLTDRGRPIGYGHLAARYPLADHQTVYATQPGSAEMASAGRPFTAELLVRLMARGILVAPVVLHAGVSSPELHEPPTAERFQVSAVTARLVNDTRTAGGRVVAVGTTAVRALESAADSGGTVHAAAGWTELILGPDQPTRVVTGLATGLHEPQASHLLLLEAVAGAALVGRAYQAAVRDRYLWHEFGDSTLFLP